MQIQVPWKKRWSYSIGQDPVMERIFQAAEASELGIHRLSGIFKLCSFYSRKTKASPAFFKEKKTFFYQRRSLPFKNSAELLLSLFSATEQTFCHRGNQRARRASCYSKKRKKLAATSLSFLRKVGLKRVSASRSRSTPEGIGHLDVVALHLLHLGLLLDDAPTAVVAVGRQVGVGGRALKNKIEKDQSKKSFVSKKENSSSPWGSGPPPDPRPRS